MLFFGPAASFTAHPYLHDKLPYDPRDLAPVARVSATLVSLAVPPSAQRQVARRLVAMARAQPGKLNWATVTGATDLVFAAFLKREASTWRRFPTAIRSGAERRGRGPPASLLVVATRSCAARSGRPRQAPGDHRRASRRRSCPALPTVDAGRLSRADLRRPGRLLRHRATCRTNCASASPPMSARSLADPTIVKPAARHRPGGGAGLAPPSSRPSIDKQRRGAAENRQGAGHQGRAAA